MTDLISREYAKIIQKNLDKDIELRQQFLAEAMESVSSRAGNTNNVPEENDRFKVLEVKPSRRRPGMLALAK